MGSAAAGGGGMDMQSILANVGGGGVGGAIPNGHHRQHQKPDGKEVARRDRCRLRRKFWQTSLSEL